jgi:hypothetical protein
VSSTEQVSENQKNQQNLHSTMQSRTLQPIFTIKTHIFCSLQAFVRLEKLRSENIISNWYEVQRNLFTLVVRDYIVDNLTNACAA